MSQQIDRRTFITALGGAVAAAATRPAWAAADAGVPAYLQDHAALYAQDPHGAALAWFREARFGLFMHYGLYSILGRGEWVMYHEQIPVAEYEKLKDQFRPDKFDADSITDLAAAAGMRYVNLTARHHDSFCLFDSRHSDYHSMNQPGQAGPGRRTGRAVPEEGAGPVPVRWPSGSASSMATPSPRSRPRPGLRTNPSTTRSATRCGRKSGATSRPTTASTWTPMRPCGGWAKPSARTAIC